MYQIYKGLTNLVVHKTNEGLWIPFDESNADYQAYLAWVAEGNTPEEWTGN
jgi:hypothetical protein